MTLLMAAAVRAPRLAARVAVRTLETGTIAHVAPVHGFVGAIGNTPLIRIGSLSDETGCDIYGKAEFMEPGGSVKDRAALYVVLDAEEKGA